MKKLLVLVLSAVLLVSGLPANAAVKAGAKCKVVGQIKVNKNKEFTCIKKDKKLVWNKGSSIATKKPKPVVTVEPVVLPLETDRKVFQTTSTCRLARPKYAENGGMSWGFPQENYWLPKSGKIKTLLVSVDFLNAKESKSPLENSVDYVKNFTDYYRSVSYGKVEIDVDIFPRWIRAGKTTQEYAAMESSGRAFATYAQEIVNSIDSEIDFSNYSVVYLISPDSAKEFFSTGPTMPNQQEVTSKEGFIKNLVIGTNPELSMGGSKWRWMAHETSHAFGLHHPFLKKDNDYSIQNIFSITDFGWIAPGLAGWERWLLDWITDSEVLCMDKSKQNNNKIVLRLNQIEDQNSNTKMAVIKLDESRAIVLDSRHLDKFGNMKKAYEGVAVYLMDVSKPLDGGAIQPILPKGYLVDKSKAAIWFWRAVGTLKTGESINSNGVEVKNIYSESSGDLIEVSFSG